MISQGMSFAEDILLEYKSESICVYILFELEYFHFNLQELRIFPRKDKILNEI